MRKIITQIQLVRNCSILGFAQTIFRDNIPEIVPYPIPKQFSLYNTSFYDTGEIPKEFNIQIQIKDCEVVISDNTIKIVEIYDEKAYTIRDCRVVSLCGQSVSKNAIMIERIDLEQN